MKYFIQKILILLFKSLESVSNSKNVLFSRFMAHTKSSYLLTKGKISKCIYVLNVNDYAVARRIYIGLDDEHLKTIKAIDWIKSIKKSNITTIFDIGANIGHISIPLLKDGIINESYMWEPDRENFKILQSNIILNDCQNSTKLYNVALGDAEEIVMLELSEDNFGDHRVRVTNEEGLYSEHNRKLLECKQKTLDSYYSDEISLCNLLVWIDVQGYEAKVLSGATNLLSRKPNLVFEFWPYGLKRAGGFNGLDSMLMNYTNWYDLSESGLYPKSLSELNLLYEKHENNDQFYLDVLLCN